MATYYSLVEREFLSIDFPMSFTGERYLTGFSFYIAVMSNAALTQIT